MSDKTESRGVSILTIKLDNYPFLKSRFFTGEKTIAVDGWFYLLKNDTDKKSDVEAQFWVQIKSHDTRKESVKVTDKISVDKSDLEFFLKNDGCMYFVVYSGANPLQDYSIYYYPFTPFRLKDELDYMNKKKTNSKLLKFYPFPEKEEDVEFIFRDFAFKVESEKGFTKYRLQTIDEVKWQKDTQIVFPFLGKHPLDIFDYQRVSYIQGYLKKSESEIVIPLDYKVLFEEISTETELKIKVHDRLFYESVIRTFNKNKEMSIKFGEAFTLTLDEKKLKINYEQPTNLKDDLLARELLVAISENKKLTINNSVIRFDESIENTVDLENNKRIIQSYKKLQSFIEKAKINKPLKIKDISQKELYQLLEIADAYLEEDIIKETDGVKEVGIKKFNISNLVIAMVVSEGKKQNYIQNLYSPNYVVYSGDSADETKRNTIFYIFSPKDWIDIDNIDYEYIKKEILNPDISIEFINRILLNLISAYDLTAGSTKAQELLDLAYKTSNYILKNSNDILHLINHYQLKVRMNLFNEEDTAQLYLFLEKGNDVESSLKFGIYVILKNRILAKKWFEEMNKKEQENIKDFPIYTLYISL